MTISFVGINDTVAVVSVLLGLGLLWILPIVLGIRQARAKGRSPAWMWFGVNPIGAWIVYGVMSFLPPLRRCPRCARSTKADAETCPNCMTPFEP
jgi:hypothetical protein